MSAVEWIDTHTHLNDDRFDGRVAGRPMMLTFDAVATLPLDAAVIQRGYA